jgi:iron complex outermembrane receptor protein
MKRKIIYSALGAVAALPFASTAIGQTSSGLSLEEVVVTARKREESLQDVPVAISAVTANQLQEKGIDNAVDLFDNVPGLALKQGLDTTSFTPSVRGVVANETATNRQKVTTFFDGMPMIGQQGMTSFGGVSQVEVLRGPQSAAFGRSTFGGAVNYISRNPTEEFELEADLEIGSDDLLNTELLVAGPIIDGKLSGLLSLYAHERGGESDWVSYDGKELGTEDTQNIEAKLVWTPSDTSEIQLRYKALETNNGTPARQYVDPYDPKRMVHPDAEDTGDVYDCAKVTALRTCAYQGAIDPVANPTFDQNFTELGIDTPGAFTDRERWEIEINQDLADGYFLQLMGMVSSEDWDQVSDLDATNSQTLEDDWGYAEGTGTVATLRRSPNFIDEQYAEVRFNSPSDDRLRWGVGASWYDYEIVGATFTGGGGSDRYDLYIAGDEDQLSLRDAAVNTGVFFNAQYDFTDKLTGSIEGRYQEDKVKAEDGDGGFVSQTTKSFLPRFALTYSPNETTSYYFQVAKGNNPSGVNETMLEDEVMAASAAYPDIFDDEEFLFYEEEEITSMEIGVKGTWNDRFRYAANAYMLDWQGYTQPLFVSFEPTDFAAADVDDDDIGDTGTIYEGMKFNVGEVIGSSGDVKGKGLEFEGNYLVTDKFEIGLTAAYMDTKYASGACTLTALIYGVEANAVPDASTNDTPTCVDVDGKDIPTQPKFIGALNLSYNQPLNNGWEWYTRWSSSYSSKQWHDEMNLAYLRPFSVTNLRTGLRSDNWGIELYGTNIFDEDSVIGIGSPADNRLGNFDQDSRRTVSYTIRRGPAFGLRASYTY